MTIIIKKKFVKKSKSDKNQKNKSKPKKPLPNNIFSSEIIFDELDKGSSHTNAYKIEQLLEKIDNKQNTPTDIEDKLNQIKSTNETDNNKKYKKDKEILFWKKKSIIKLRRINKKIKRYNYLHKKYKIIKNKESKINLKNKEDFIYDSVTKQTPTKQIKKILNKIEKETKINEKLNEKKLLVNKDKNRKHHKDNKKIAKKKIKKDKIKKSDRKSRR